MNLRKLLRATFVVALFAFVACDEDYTGIGGEIINNPTNVELREFEVNAATRKINSVQTNNLTQLSLGTYTDPVYGKSTSSIVSQLALGTPDPEFGENVVLDSVVLTMPYFSEEVESSDSDDVSYTLDSIYGNGSFKLSIYETSYFLNDLDPGVNFEQRQKYYSDQQQEIENFIVGEALYTDSQFEVSDQPYTSYEVGEDGENDTIVNAPALRVQLPVQFFKDKIIAKEGSQELLTSSNFKNYFRSLLIKAEENSSEGLQFLTNLASANAKITLYYNYEEEVDEETVRKRGSLNLNFTGANKFNTYTGEFPDQILQSINDQSLVQGSEALYLKSQEGSMAVIDLFPDDTSLQDLRNEDLLINEANLIFYLREDLSIGEKPKRLYLYNLSTNSFLADFSADITFTNNDPENSLTNFSQPLETGEDENGSYYKLRITSHITNLLNNEDAEDVKLGLVVVSNINAVASRDSQGSISGPNNSATRNVSENVSQVPSPSLTSPYGVVLHGDESADEGKRLKLRIYYTEY